MPVMVATSRSPEVSKAIAVGASRPLGTVWVVFVLGSKRMI